MSRVIAIANQKGGVAKTTTTANLGAALHELGYRVLLVDMDPQASLTVWSGRNPDDLERTTYDSLIKEVDSREILLPTPIGPDLLPANIDLSLAEIELIHTVNRERRLAGMLAPLRDDYDFVLMDCQPSLGLLTVNAFGAADEVLVPLVCEFLSTRAVDVLMRVVRRVKVEVNSQLKVAGILPTMFDGRLRHVRAELERLEQQFEGKVPVLSACAVPRTVRFAESAALGQSILSYMPTHAGSEAYRRLAEYLLGDSAGPDAALSARREAAAAADEWQPMVEEWSPTVQELRIDVFTRKDSGPNRRR